MKKLFLIVSIICFVSCFPANADTRDVAPLEKVSIQLKWFHQFQFAGYYAAAEKGFYAEEGLEVTLKEQNPQKSPIRSVLDGDVKYGVADAGLLAERMKGEPVVLLKQIYQHSPLVFLTLKKSGIITPYDLVGKNVMVGTEGLNNAALLEMMLTTIGGMGNVTSIPHSYNLDDLITGKVDAVSAYITSQTYKLKQQGIEFYIINPRNFGIDFYGDNLFTTEKEIHAHPDRVKKMIRATLKGWEYALAHPQEIIDLILKKYNPDLNRDQLVYEAKMTDLMILSEITPLGTVTSQRYEQIADTYRSAGFAGANVDLNDFIYGSVPRLARYPGFLQASEKAWLAEYPIIMSAADYDFPPFSIANEAGEADGFSVELLKASANAIDIDVEFYSAPWAKIKEELATGKLDALPVVGRTPEREADFDFTVPYITIYGNVYVREGDNRIREIEDLEDMQVVVKNKDNAEEFAKRVQISKNIIALDSFEEAFTLLSKGSYDAIITNEVVGTRVIDKLGIDNIVSILQIDEYKQDFTFAVTEGNKELLALLNEGLSRVIADGTYDRLRAKWFEKPQQIQLTSEERAWLGKNHVVRVRVRDAPPWEINTPKPIGMSVDYLTIIGRQFGINFKFLPGTDAWIDGFNDMAGDHLKYDLLPAVKRTPERLELLAISDDYLHSPWVVFTHEKIFDIFSLEYLRGRKVAVERGYVMQKLLEKNEPEIELVIQESTEDALIAVSTMKADAYVGNLIVTSHLIQRVGIINVKVVCPTPFGYHSQAMATRQEWTPLISIINKGLTNISQKEKINIQNKYSAVRFEHGIRIMDIIKWVIGVSSVLLTILSIILIWNRKLQQEIIQRKAVEEDLKHTKEEAEAANRSKSMFLANMSHELRTPLNAILGFGRNLARAQDLTPEHRNEVDIIRRSGDHLLQMIDEILSLSRIEAGRVELQRAPFDLVRTLEDMGQMMTVRAQAKGLRFDLELDAALPRVVQGDVGKTRQVLINLLGNAIKFTQQGYVCLRASTKPLDSDPARVLLQMAVEDSGVVIPEEQLDTIFDSFMQGNPTDDTVQGTGLGLAICRSLVDMMEGRIDVTSKPGEGSLFTVTVPVELAEATALDLEAIRETQVVGLKPGQKPKRILVADDNVDNRALLTNILERVGFTVREVENGETPIEAFNSWGPHLICMDMRMPVMDGYAATKAIRQLEGGKEVKVLAVTASVFEEQRDEILSAGCDDLICKPVRENEIFDAIGRLLGVQYEYADVEQPAVPDSGIELTQEMLSQLPPELLAELRRATLVLDRAVMAVLIERIEAHAPETAKGLQRLVDGFQFEQIRDLLGRMEKWSDGVMGK